MNKIIFFFILLLLYPIITYSKDSNENWDEIIKKTVPKELTNIRVIEKKDIIDPDNLNAFNKYNPNIIIKDDFNNNGKEDMVVPCISKNDKDSWYILIFEKSNCSYLLIAYFQFNVKSIYVFKPGKTKKKLIRVGQSFASDAWSYIWWKNGRYIKTETAIID